jgi:putative selenate reductase
MSERVAPLYPWSMSRLMGRIAWELEQHDSIFSLPSRRFFRDAGDLSVSDSLAGQTVATPVGPAAGPHTQLAQNIVLSWLAGARSFELKTVQILDELDIERPCIDMENVGYNIEWSQELTLEQSLQEYVKAAVMLEVLGQWEPLRGKLGRPGNHAFELSVGYDLAGVKSEKMTRFIQGLVKAEEIVDSFRSEITGPFASLRDVPVPGQIIRTATISTFHGCPPDEVEGIVRHLMTAHGLDVTVKLNPTLLGLDTVREILHDRLGYTDVPLVRDAFTEDQTFEGALELIHRLHEFAASEGREFGIKLTNTLVVGNNRGVMPGERMYLSGKPLHVLAITLLDRLVAELPDLLRVGTGNGPVPVAFSAGIDKTNMADTVALGLSPVTICSDLLKPGGYGRMAAGLRGLVKKTNEAGGSLEALRQQADDQARSSGYRDAVAALAARLNSEEGCVPYTLAATEKPLRRVDQALQMFDCVACNNCVTVCPNNAFWAVPSQGVADLTAKSQYLVLAELCNECGNCKTFCPEEGDPAMIKPRLFTDKSAWLQDGQRGFHLEGAGESGLTGGQEGQRKVLGQVLNGEVDQVLGGGKS